MVGDARIRVAVVGFAHPHAGRQVEQVLKHPAAELVGVWDSDPARRDAVADDLGVLDVVRHADLGELLEQTAPDLAVVCSTTGEHTELVERLAGRGVHVVLEEPFAPCLADADRMIEATEEADTLLAVDWPLAWCPAHLTTRRLVAEGTIGRVTEVHHHDGDLATGTAPRWSSPEGGGGSLLHHLGHGATLATWFRDGEVPDRVSALTWGSPGLAVDEQSAVAASYPSGLSTFSTGWGTSCDPWTVQPAPACGFVVVGAAGTITSRHLAPAVVVQTTAHPEPVAVPVDVPRADQTGALAHVIACLQGGTRPTGPASAAISRKGQQIVDTAVASASTGRVTALLGPTPGNLVGAR